MPQRKSLFVLGLAVLLSVPCESAFGQLRGGSGRPRAGGARLGPGGARGLSNPRSGLNSRSNPIANPAPSLTPHEVLNPRGSLSAGQVLNPAPSLNRPRSGGSLPGTNVGNPTTAVGHQSARSNLSDDTGTSDDTVLRAISPAPRTMPVGEKILESVVSLDAQLGKVAPDKGWAKRLSLDELRTVAIFSEEPANDSQRQTLENILQAYQAVAKDERSANINKLPAFKQTLKALQAYLSPIDLRRRRQAAAAFQQLANELGAFKNGASWVEHLVPAELTSTNGKTSISDEQAEKLSKRFGRLAGNPDYDKVTSLAGFKPAYNGLKVVFGKPTEAGEASEVSDPSVDSTSPKSTPNEIVNPPAGTSDQSAQAPPLDNKAMLSPASAATTVAAGEKVLESVVALDAQLEKVAPDTAWSERLFVDELRGDVPVFSEQPAGDRQRAALEKILNTYQVLAKDDQSANISNLPEFSQTLEALQDYLTPIDVRRRQEATTSFQQLASDLTSYKNGASWVEYLVPKKLTTTDDETSMPSEEVEKLLKRFNKLTGNPDYNEVTSLPGFNPARDALKATVGQTTP